MSRRKKPLPPPGPGRYIRAEVVEGENELRAGQPAPPVVDLTPAGPAFAISEGENELGSPTPTAPRRPTTGRLSEAAGLAAVFDAVDRRLLAGLLAGRDLAELAAELSLSREAADQRLGRIRRRLARSLGE